MSHFNEPPEIITETEDWWPIGLPQNLIALASDAMGNKFCFSSGDMKTRHETAPVWFWVHDFNETTKLGDSFSEWLELYVDLGKPGLFERILRKG
ncbi:SMI1/KNR4 family protein [Primorskyibacter sp. 2E107]|uniref:SMI1/KNR4 family protein n=1 Tax=Primorskyibacter sp. 2E107 TaxID=3403458 RepID=UPI003AF96A4B